MIYGNCNDCERFPPAAKKRLDLKAKLLVWLVPAMLPVFYRSRAHPKLSCNTFDAAFDILTPEQSVDSVEKWWYHAMGSMRHG
jgi:hypothetical protein